MAHKLLFFGNERLATGVTTTAPTLRALAENGYKIEALLLAQNIVGKSRKPRDLEIVQVAKEHGIPVLTPKTLTDAKDKLKQYEAEAAILVAYGKLVPKEIIDLFPKGIINIHPSLLPKHRGSIPIEAALLYNETETGVSLMQLVERMDAGPLYAQKKVKLKGDATKQELADQLLNLGKDLLLKHLPAILDGSLKPEMQDEDEYSSDSKIGKESATLDFNERADVLERRVRAYASWPRARAMVGTEEVIITQAHVIETNGVVGTLWLGNKELGIHAQEGVLVIDKLIPPGKKEMTGEAFLAGYKPI